MKVYYFMITSLSMVLLRKGVKYLTSKFDLNHTNLKEVKEIRLLAYYQIPKVIRSLIYVSLDYYNQVAPNYFPIQETY